MHLLVRPVLLWLPRIDPLVVDVQLDERHALSRLSPQMACVAKGVPLSDRIPVAARRCGRAARTAYVLFRKAFSGPSRSSELADEPLEFGDAVMGIGPGWLEGVRHPEP